jgi:hypothetical protein
MLPERKHPCLYQYTHPSSVLVLFFYLKAKMSIYLAGFRPIAAWLRTCKQTFLESEIANTVSGSLTKP